jgi:glycosyltransferase involved in cell wall biosynthesis
MPVISAVFMFWSIEILSPSPPGAGNDSGRWGNYSVWPLFFAPDRHPLTTFEQRTTSGVSMGDSGRGAVEFGEKTDSTTIRSVVAFDLRSATGRATGAGRYLLSVALAATDLEGIAVRAYLGKTDLNLPAEVEKVAVGWAGLRWHLSVWKHLREHPVRAYVSTSLIVPLLPGVRALPAVLDVSCFRVPQFQRRRTRLFERTLLGSVVRRHPLIFLCEAAGADVQDLFRTARGIVVPPWFGHGHAIAENQAAVSRLGAQKPYLLVVGTVEPRKNVTLAIQATRELRRRGHDLQLVIVGSRGWARAAEIEEIRRAQAEGIVVWPGYVSDEERDALYAGASAMLFPSLYEGFGMPLIEAMAAGLPCVRSTIPVFDEVAGDAALRADPHSPDDWADRLEELIGRPELAEELRVAGRDRAAFFSRERTAQALRGALAQRH